MLHPLLWLDLLQSGPLKDCLQKNVLQTDCNRHILDLQSLCAGDACSQRNSVKEAFLWSPLQTHEEPREWVFALQQLQLFPG